MKFCNTCKTNQPKLNFNKSKDGKEGLGSQCKSCKLWANRKRKFGLTRQEIEAIFEGQGKKCAICLKLLPARYEVDHSHEDGRIRGILCIGCNTSLGKFGDSPVLLKRAIDYLNQNCSST